MAIELPSASAASVGTAGRRARARVPDVGDVPQVRVAGDPGVQVPNFAQFAGGLEDVGGVVSEAGLRIKNRTEGLARGRDDNEYGQYTAEAFRELQENADLADDQVVDNAIALADEEMSRILGAHSGGPGSLAVLEIALGRRNIDFRDKLAAESILAGRRQHAVSVDQAIKGIVSDALKNTEIPFEQRFGQLKTTIELLGLSGAEASAAQINGEEKIASALINLTISRGILDENGFLIGPREMLENEALDEVLSPGLRAGFMGRVINLENTIRQTGLKMQGEAIALENIARRLGMDAEDTRDFIIGTLSEGKVNDKQAALNRLVGKGLMDQDTADKVAGGVFRVVPFRDQFGQVEGAMIVDLSQPSSAAIPSPTDQPATTPPQPEPTPPRISPPSEAAELDQERSLFDIATGSVAVTGLEPKARDVLQGIVGQFGVKISSAEQQIFRRRFNNARLELAESFVPNERFPQAQVELVIKSADIETGAFKDRQSLLSSMVALDQTLKARQIKAERDASDESLPNDTKAAQATNARVIANFRETLGVPEGITPQDIENIKPPETGTITDVGDFIKRIVSGAPEAEAVTTVPSVEEILKMSKDEIRALGKELSSDTEITIEQGEAIKKILGIGEETPEAVPGKISFDPAKHDLLEKGPFKTFKAPKGVLAAPLSEFLELERHGGTDLLEVPENVAEKLDKKLLKYLNAADDKTLQALSQRISRRDRQRAGEPKASTDVSRERQINFIFKNIVWLLKGREV